MLTLTRQEPDSFVTGATGFVGHVLPLGQAGSLDAICAILRPHGRPPRLLADPDLRRRQAHAARERITALCGWDAVVDTTLAACSDALGKTS